MFDPHFGHWEGGEEEIMASAGVLTALRAEVTDIFLLQ
jgi:hypothetical protein